MGWLNRTEERRIEEDRQRELAAERDAVARKSEQVKQEWDEALRAEREKLERSGK